MDGWIIITVQGHLDEGIAADMAAEMVRVR